MKYTKEQNQYFAVQHIKMYGYCPFYKFVEYCKSIRLNVKDTAELLTPPDSPLYISKDGYVGLR